MLRGPPIQHISSKPLDKGLLKETMRELTSIMSTEWMEEAELSPKIFKFMHPLPPFKVIFKGQ